MGLGCFFEPSPLRFKFFFREDNQEHEENKSQDAYKDFQEIGRRSLCARGHVPHDQQIVVAAAQAFDGKIPVLADGIVFFSQAPIGVMEEPRDFGLIFVSIVFGFESVVERNGVFRAFVGLGEVHHAFFEVRERHIFKGRLLSGLSDKEVFGFEDLHEMNSRRSDVSRTTV